MTANQSLPYRRLSGNSGHDASMHEICPSTSRNSHIYVRTLHEACVILGGEHKLAAFLGVSVEVIEGWLNGRSRPPDSVFLRCLDLVEANPRR